MNYKILHKNNTDLKNLAEALTFLLGLKDQDIAFDLDLVFALKKFKL